MIIDEAWVVLDLRALREITSFAEAHRDLAIDTLHVLVHRLCLLQHLAVDFLQHLGKTIVYRVDVVGTSILNWQSFFQLRHTGWLAEFRLIANFSKLGCVTLTRRSLKLGGVPGRRWGRTSNKVSVELLMPRCFRLRSKADQWQISPFSVKRVATRQRW